MRIIGGRSRCPPPMEHGRGIALRRVHHERGDARPPIDGSSYHAEKVASLRSAFEAFVQPLIPRMFGTSHAPVPAPTTCKSIQRMIITSWWVWLGFATFHSAQGQDTGVSE